MLNFLSSLWTYHLEEQGTQDTLPTSRVCGWTNSYRNCPCRVEMLFIEKKQITSKSEEKVLHRKKQISWRKLEKQTYYMEINSA